MPGRRPVHVSVPVPVPDGGAAAAWLAAQVPAHDVVIDCTDNFKTRHLINAACVAAKKPLVFGAAIQMAGQLSVFDTRDAESPCYACLFPADQMPEEVSCASMGVLCEEEPAIIRRERVCTHHWSNFINPSEV